MKKFLVGIALLGSSLLFAQDKGYFYGGLESNSQWLLDDDGLPFIAPDEAFRSNNYFQLNYAYGDFSAGVQYESYLPNALLGYAPDYDGGNGIATYFLNYRDKSLDVTGGYFYEQFGNGLLLRTWEDRQLGINSALHGLRVKFSPTDFIDLTGVYGQQRVGFELSEGVIQGVDAAFDLGSALKTGEVDLRAGVSYVGRYQDTNANDTIPSTVNAYSARADFVIDKFYGGVEVGYKEEDVIANEGLFDSDRLYDGTALQVNMGYAQRGLGINATFRRLENFSFYSDRTVEGNQFNQQLINYTPALTKQQDYMLTNIYVYNAQPRLLTEGFEQRAGEVGAQVDVYYSFPKESPLGKVNTKIAGNFSYWGGLETEFNEDLSYDVKFIGDGDRYFRDINFEVKNRWSSAWSTVATFQSVIIDKGVSLGGPLGVQGDIKAITGVGEATYRFGKGQSFRFALQHLWSQQDRGNWAAGVIEYSPNSRLNFFIADNFNYQSIDGDFETDSQFEDPLHYYNIGGSYSKGRTRFSMNYGRQRGGLICVGGVCRFVPESNGLNMNLVVTF
ncbi:DUF6029 family protein [Flavobacteriaceae bacterium TK19130]|nr:DUF6029 family protein [Thermobacterium salinum]